MRTTIQYCLFLLLVVLMSHTGYAQTWTKIGITNPTTGWADVPAITIDKSGTVYVTFLNVNSQASVMKYNGTTWTTIGNANISAGMISNCGEPTPIVTDAAGTPYIAYPDTGAKATVMKFNGSSWVVVGTPGISAGQATGITLVTDGSIPYIAYNDTSGGKATVKKFTGTGWVTVGSPNFTPGYALFPSLAIAPGGTPYIAFSDGADGNDISVMKFDGIHWVAVGAPGLTGGAALYPSLCIDKNGTPYIAFEGQGITASGAVVMKFNGANWVNVGPVASPGGQFPTLALDTSGTPYISFSDQSTPLNQATVKKFNGTNWVTVGTAGFSAGGVNYAPIAIDPSGTPYVTYTDTETTIGHVAVMKLEADNGVNSINRPAASVSVFPNPGNGAFTINIASPTNEDATVTITNVTGEQVKELTVPTNKRTPLQLRVAPGTYYLSATVKNGKVASKIVVE